MLETIERQHSRGKKYLDPASAAAGYEAGLARIRAMAGDERWSRLRGDEGNRAGPKLTDRHMGVLEYVARVTTGDGGRFRFGVHTREGRRGGPLTITMARVLTNAGMIQEGNTPGYYTVTADGFSALKDAGRQWT